jgi:RNA polymerase sigma-70 factor (ECF subfamily)
MSDPDRGSRFVRLFLQHERRILGLILALVPHGPDADDILQEASAVMWEKFDDFDPSTNFAAWALRIARFQVMAYYSTRRRQRARLSDETMDAVVERMAARPARDDARAAALEGCLERLPADDRTLLEQRYRAEVPTDELARRAGRTVFAIYKSLDKIHDRLLHCVQSKLAREGTG